jgi:hypothetical protein
LDRQNLALNQGFSGWMSLQHPDVRAAAESHYRPGTYDITGPRLRELGEFLIEISTTWRVGK